MPVASPCQRRTSRVSTVAGGRAAGSSRRWLPATGTDTKPTHRTAAGPLCPARPGRCLTHLSQTVSARRERTPLTTPAGARSRWSRGSAAVTRRCAPTVRGYPCGTHGRRERAAQGWRRGRLPRRPARRPARRSPGRPARCSAGRLTDPALTREPSRHRPGQGGPGTLAASLADPAAAACPASCPTTCPPACSTTCPATCLSRPSQAGETADQTRRARGNGRADYFPESPLYGASTDRTDPVLPGPGIRLRSGQRRRPDHRLVLAGVHYLARTRHARPGVRRRPWRSR